nr:ABC transporter F family member 4-like [Leptinotarsa decemlineata]
MENLYGIGVANRYALFLDDESDPLETLSLKELEKDSKKKNKVAEKENKVKSEPLSKGKTAPAPKKIIKDNNRDQENKREDVKSSQRSIVDNKQDREKNSNKYNNENREERNNRRNREDKPFNGHFENR